MIILIIIIVACFPLLNTQEEDEEEVVVETEETGEIKQEKIKVDIKGEVNAVGVYELETGARVIDLIEKAGGLTKNADTSIINLSKTLEDENVVIIYSKSEVKQMQESNQTCECPTNNDACITNEQVDTLLDTSSSDTNASKTNGKISINTATQEELQTLEGIGEAKAKAIYEYRQKNGNFETIEDIKNVSGIGDSIYEKIKNNITV